MTNPDAAHALPAQAPCIAAQALLRRITVPAALAAAALAAAVSVPPRLAGAAALEIRRSAIAALPLSAILLLLAGLLATTLIAAKRTRASVSPAEEPRLSRAARIPQAIIVPSLAGAAAVIAYAMRPTLAAPVTPPNTGFLLGGIAIGLSFLLLIAERHLHAANTTALPEAPALRALAFTATAATFTAGVLEIAANIGAPFTPQIGIAVVLVIAAIGAELTLRALGRLFLPPPAPHAARAACASTLARALTAGARAQGGIAAPLREHLGIDFSRSWALVYLRAATLPMLGFLLLLAWGLSGVSLIPLDGRAIYERFGAPVAVLHPGLHAGLPWPLGATRAVEYGPVHAIYLSETAPDSTTLTGAEDPAPASADRLWEQAHPAEVQLLIASAANNRQSFQSVSADIRILYRVGLTDNDAVRAAYAIATPEAFVRAAAGHVTTGYFAARTLDSVLGANREAMALSLRAQLQSALDAAQSGLTAVAVVIEAIHPPAGAADAYHNVRAAEIAARASVAVERGAAATVIAQSQQYVFDLTSNAQARAAETTGGARTALLRFTADQLAAKAGGQSFLLERYFAALTSALARTPKTIIDHRLNWPEAPVLDLRPFAAATTAGTGKEE
jgi:regulator of protease activity HflC (stomatin/prohibitin superfamily)